MRASAAVAAAGVLGAAGAAAAWRADRRWKRAADPCEPDHLTPPQGDETKVVTDDGAVLAVTVAGDPDGPTVVLAHGWTNARMVWSPVAHRLVASGRRVVLYDQRGHGQSTAGTGGFGIERLAADMAAVLEEVDVRDAVVAGHSMGGMTAQALAILHPDLVRQRVRSFVLVATAAHGVGKSFGALAARVVGAPAVDRALGSRGGHALLRGTVGSSPRHRHLVVTRDLFVACDPAARVGCLTELQAMDLRHGLAAIAVPTTVVIGTRDRLTPPRLGRAIASSIPGARLEVLDGRGHMLPLEAPDELADILSKS